MTGYSTEEQQLEVIRDWFKKNGKSLFLFTVLIIATGAGVYFWRHHKEVSHQQASLHYYEMMQGYQNNDKQTVNAKAALLMEEFQSTPYSVLGAFTLAKEAVNEKDLEKAKGYLEWAHEHALTQDLKLVAKTRLARVLIAQDKLDAALALIEKGETEGYKTLIEEIKGDIYLKKEDKEKARFAYQAALFADPEKGASRPILKMKLEDLGGHVEVEQPAA